MNIPEGWKLVPIEPTEEMLEAIDLNLTSFGNYIRLLAAAPTPPVPEVEPVGVSELIDAVGEQVKELLRNDFRSLVSEMSFAKGILERDDELRKAARWAVKQHQTSGGLVGLAMENLRAELNKDKSC